MIDLKTIVRPNILCLEAYSSARDEYQGEDGIFLDANENPFGLLNRYPDPQQVELKTILAKKKGVQIENIFIGNGSDELIDLAFRIFCTPGIDRVLTFTPTYGMYAVSAAINDVELLECPLTDTFQIDIDLALATIEKVKPKLIFICSPNNPTGNTLDADSIQEILRAATGIVIIDEAYIDFSDSSSWTNVLNDFPNLIVSQTFSKAYGLAAARVGVGYASTQLISLFNRVKPPYNVSALNQDAATLCLQDEASFQKNLGLIKSEKIKLENAFQEIEIITKIYPSDANFILIELINATEIYQSLIAQKIITRNRSTLIANTIRVTVGSPEENQTLINALKTI